MSTPVASLTGRRILLTRAADDADRWATRLRRRGHVPVILPCLRVEHLHDADTAQALREAIEGATWVVFTSRRGVEAAHALIGEEWPRSTPIAAVGPATARAVGRTFGTTPFVARPSTGAALGRALADHMEGNDGSARIVLAGARDGRDDVAVALGRAGIAVTRVALYRTIPNPPLSPRVLVETADVDAVWLASPSAVTGLRNQARLARELRIISIGPTTTDAATAAGFTVSAEARTPTFSGMLQATR